jgi:hypothetical protein
MEIAIITSLLAKWNMNIYTCQMFFLGNVILLFFGDVENFSKDTIFLFLLFFGCCSNQLGVNAIILI